MTAAHVLVETTITTGLTVFAVWLLRELVRFCDREIRRRIDCALGDRYDVFPDDEPLDDVAYVEELAARWARKIRP